MPKTKSKTKSAKPTLPGVTALLDVDDWYGEKYMIKISEIELFPCFFCNVQLSDYVKKCGTCKREYNCCRKHKSYIDSMVMGLFHYCIFCERRYNDKVLEALGGVSNHVNSDLTGKHAVIEFLENKEKVSEPNK